MRWHQTEPACMVRRRSTVRFRNGTLVDSLIRKDSNGLWMPVGLMVAIRALRAWPRPLLGGAIRKGSGDTRSRQSDLGSLADLRIRTLGGLASARAPALVRPRDGLDGPGDRSSEELQAQQRDGQGRASGVPAIISAGRAPRIGLPSIPASPAGPGRRGHPARAWAPSGQCPVPVK